LTVKVDAVLPVRVRVKLPGLAVTPVAVSPAAASVAATVIVGRVCDAVATKLKL
jgi:hypothetical protein